MATGYCVCVHIAYGHRVISSTGPRGQPGVNPYRDCAEIVRKSCNVRCSCRAVSAASARKSYGARAGTGVRTVPVRGLCNATYDMSTSNGLTIFFLTFVKLLAKPNRRGRGARESVRKSHSRLLPPQGGLAEAARKGGYGQDTGSVDPSQAKYELGKCLVHICPGRRAINLYTIFRATFGHRRCMLRATAYVFTLSTGIVRFLLRGLGGNPG